MDEVLGFGAGSGSHLPELGLEALVWRLQEVNGLLILLPYLKVFIDLEAIPNDGSNEKTNWSLGRQPPPSCWGVLMSSPFRFVDIYTPP